MREDIDGSPPEFQGEGPRVYHEVDNTYYSAGPGSFIHDLYSTLGAENIAEATGEAYPQLSAEAIIQAIWKSSSSPTRSPVSPRIRLLHVRAGTR
jgi:iron complex transport system substrate-binding protein